MATTEAQAKEAGLLDDVEASADEQSGGEGRSGESGGRKGCRGEDRGGEGCSGF